MKRFLCIVALFLAPVFLFVGLFAGAIYASGEWRTEEEIAAKVAAGEPAFFGLAYRDNTRYYKHLVANGLGADLLVLGTSRSMQFHSEFFTTDSFYNAGGGAGYVNEFQYFLEQLDEDGVCRGVSRTQAFPDENTPEEDRNFGNVVDILYKLGRGTDYMSFTF